MKIKDINGKIKEIESMVEKTANMAAEGSKAELIGQAVLITADIKKSNRSIDILKIALLSFFTEDAE